MKNVMMLLVFVFLSGVGYGQNDEQHKHLGGTLFADQFRTSFGFLFNTRNLKFLSKRLRDSRV